MASTLLEKIGDKIQRASNRTRFMMTRSRRRFLKLTAAMLAMPALLRTGFAADWPTEKPIRAIVPFHHQLARPYRTRSCLGGTIDSFDALIKREIASNLAVSL